MADPLSILGSLAGVITGGIQLSRSLYEVIQLIKNAPLEIAELAGELSFLSHILTTVSDVLEEGQELYTEQVLWEIKEITSRIKTSHKELWKMTKNDRGFQRFAWLFRSGKAKSLQLKIEGHKTAMSLVLSTMQLALHQRNTLHTHRRQSQDDIEQFNYLMLAENYVQAARKLQAQEPTAIPVVNLGPSYLEPDPMRGRRSSDMSTTNSSQHRSAPTVTGGVGGEDATPHDYSAISVTECEGDRDTGMFDDEYLHSGRTNLHNARGFVGSTKGILPSGQATSNEQLNGSDKDKHERTQLENASSEYQGESENDQEWPSSRSIKSSSKSQRTFSRSPLNRLALVRYNNTVALRGGISLGEALEIRSFTPNIVVKRLLLEWTIMTEEQVESSTALVIRDQRWTKPFADERRGSARAQEYSRTPEPEGFARRDSSSYLPSEREYPRNPSPSSPPWSGNGSYADYVYDPFFPEGSPHSPPPPPPDPRLEMFENFLKQQQAQKEEGGRAPKEAAEELMDDPRLRALEAYIAKQEAAAEEAKDKEPSKEETGLMKLEDLIIKPQQAVLAKQKAKEEVPLAALNAAEGEKKADKGRLAQLHKLIIEQNEEESARKKTMEAREKSRVAALEAREKKEGAEKAAAAVREAKLENAAKKATQLAKAEAEKAAAAEKATDATEKAAAAMREAEIKELKQRLAQLDQQKSNEEEEKGTKNNSQRRSLRKMLFREYRPGSIDAFPWATDRSYYGKHRPR